MNKSEKSNIQEKPKSGLTPQSAIIAAVIATAALVASKQYSQKPEAPQIQSLANTSNSDGGIHNLAKNS